jgi:hypothetical protein
MFFNANQLRFEENVAEMALYLSPFQSHKNEAVGRFHSTTGTSSRGEGHEKRGIVCAF